MGLEQTLHRRPAVGLATELIEGQIDNAGIELRGRHVARRIELDSAAEPTVLEAGQQRTKTENAVIEPRMSLDAVQRHTADLERTRVVRERPFAGA